MNKLILTLIATFSAISIFAQGVRLGPPKAWNSDVVQSQSVNVTYDTSLLKALVLFDELDNSYMALNYEVAQLDGLFNAPLRLGMAGAYKGDKEYWAGPSLTYGFLNTQKISMGLVMAFPGVSFSGNTVDFSTNVRAIPGLSVSIRW